MSEEIKKGDFIKIAYTGSLLGGVVFDTTSEDVAKEHGIYQEGGRYGGDVIIVGAGHTVPGLEEDFIGKEVGYKGKVVVPPEKGFGDVNPELVKLIPINKFETKPSPGAKVTFQGISGTVKMVIGRKVKVDFNPPMAGRTITYEYEILERITDTKDKIKSLIHLYTGQDLEVKVDNGTARIEIPPYMAFNPKWLQIKNRVAFEIIKYTECKEVIFEEKISEDHFSQKPAEETTTQSSQTT